MAGFFHIDITKSVVAEMIVAAVFTAEIAIACDRREALNPDLRFAKAVIATAALPFMYPEPEQNPGTSHFGAKPPKSAKPPACSFSSAL